MMQHDDIDSLQIGPDPDKLYRYHRQQLSAMLDGELSPDQARFMLRRLQHDVELADCWERWQVCGDVLRGQRNALLPADFAQKVAIAIAGDTGGHAAAVPAREARPRLLRWGGGAALAASVAMAALLVARQPGVGPAEVPPQAAPEVAAASTASPDPTVVGEPVSPSSLSTGTAVALAGTVLAAAEAPRRGGEERRSRGQSQRAAATRPQRGADEATRTLAASAAPATVDVYANDRAQAPATVLAALPSVQGIGADPFAALPMAAASRPWPQAVMPGAGNAQYAVGHGAVTRSLPVSFHPFEPQVDVAPALFGVPRYPAGSAPASTAIGAEAVPADDDVPSPDSTPDSTPDTGPR